jgi:hypothetical protein
MTEQIEVSTRGTRKENRRRGMFAFLPLKMFSLRDLAFLYTFAASRQNGAEI